MGVAELFTSMQQGVVDGQENPLEIVDSLKFYEVQKFAIDTRHIIGAMTWILSDARLKRLPGDVQKLLREEGDKAMLAATDRMIGMEGQLRTKLQSAGMKINDIDRAELARRVEPIGKEFPDLVPWVAKFRQTT
jgi:TRAP-type C4-dicarboxylate transport system substrate-binding protein